MGYSLQESALITKHQDTESNPESPGHQLHTQEQGSTTFLLPKRTYLAWVQYKNGGHAWVVLHNPVGTGEVTYGEGNLPLRCTAQWSPSSLPADSIEH